MSDSREYNMTLWYNAGKLNWFHCSLKVIFVAFP